MKNYSYVALAMGLLFATLSCSQKKNTTIEGVLAQGEEKEVIVKLLDVNRFQVLDTVKTDANGAFTYALDLKEAQPEFIYLYYGDRQVASLLLQKGDKVTVHTDTLGAYSVEGSEESLKLQKVENAYNAFMRDMSGILSSKILAKDATLSRRYVDYYRDRLAYVVKNPHSLTVVPVLFQQLNENTPVFGQATDGFLMRNVADSLKMDYPESRYVKALEKEAEKRVNLMEINARVSAAPQVGYINMDLPGIDGKKVSLMDKDQKVTMVYFWATTAEQKMFNLDALVPIYEEFHPKGFEIYAVSLNADKTTWATAVRNQKLPWVNVCDTRGIDSPYVYAYGVTQLPMAWFIVDGSLDPDAKVRNAEDIRKYLKKKL